MTDAQFVTAQQVNVFDVLFDAMLFGNETQWRDLGVVRSVRGRSKPNPDDMVEISVYVHDGRKTYVYPATYQLAVIRGEKWETP